MNSRAGELCPAESTPVSFIEFVSQGQWGARSEPRSIFNAARLVKNNCNRRRRNGDSEQRTLSLQLKQQLTPDTSIYVQAIDSKSTAGDLRPCYNNVSPFPRRGISERQERHRATESPDGPFRYQSDLEIYPIELQHLWRRNEHQVTLGVRYQFGTSDPSSRLGESTPAYPGTNRSVLISSAPVAQEIDSDFHRFGSYAFTNIVLNVPNLRKTPDACP